uniref:Ty3/gypsy retrotransposon protein n=1 Tax=Tanacetum cinerariifolium TaxID=118510 RepID=A0A699TC46_TANCI|nr:Ty3/gypsy retrotransposon protein [Tanacetum cinerariifolium]
MAIGAVLSQENKPIAFFSKKLCQTMQGQSTYTKEFYAITEAVKKWRQYLLGRREIVYPPDLQDSRTTPCRISLIIYWWPRQYQRHSEEALKYFYMARATEGCCTLC